MPMLFEYFSKQYKPSTLKRNDKQLRLAIHLAVERPSFEPADEWGSSMERRKKEIGIYFFFKLAGDIIIETATAESPRLQRTVGFFQMKRLQASQF
jgi:hypothetical protein